DVDAQRPSGCSYMTLNPHQSFLALIVYWAILTPVAAFILRQACSLFQVEMPSYRRAIFMVLVVGGSAYLTFEFSSYVIMLSMQGVFLQVPPGYGFIHWLHEPFGVKWQIISKLPMLGYLPFIFSLCIAGILQVVWLRLQVPFRLAVLILLFQAAVTYAAMLGLPFTFHNLLGVKVEPAPDMARREAAPTPQPAPRQATTPPALAFEKSDGKSTPSFGDYWRG